MEAASSSSRGLIKDFSRLIWIGANLTERKAERFADLGGRLILSVLDVVEHLCDIAAENRREAFAEMTAVFTHASSSLFNVQHFAGQSRIGFGPLALLYRIRKWIRHGWALRKA